MTPPPPAKPPPGVAGQASRPAGTLARLLQVPHGLLTWLAFLVAALAALPLLALLPPLRWRRAVVRRVAQLALATGGMRLRVTGRETLPHPSVVVANHASYLDGIVLTACLPPDFGFVIKREMNSVPLAAWLLRLIGAEFVERRGRAAGARDALRVVRLAARGHALVFFPEGTFERTPGLLPFHRGAFAAAARAGLPVVPTVILGTRDCLRPGTLLPRPGRIEVRLLPPIAPDPRVDDPVTALRDAARSRILEHVDEPDRQPQPAPGKPA